MSENFLEDIGISTSSNNQDFDLIDDIAEDANFNNYDLDDAEIIHDNFYDFSEKDINEYEEAVNNDNIKNSTITYLNREQEISNLFDEALNVDQETVKDRGKKKGARSEDFIIIDDTADENFIIVNDNKKILRIVFKIIKYLFAIIICCALAAFGLFISLFRVIPCEVKGASFKIGDYSIVSTNYQPNLDELMKGETFIISTTSDYSPYIYEYDTYTYNYRNSIILYCTDAYGNEVKVEAINVDYILAD